MSESKETTEEETETKKKTVKNTAPISQAGQDEEDKNG